MGSWNHCALFQFIWFPIFLILHNCFNISRDPMTLFSSLLQFPNNQKWHSWSFFLIISGIQYIYLGLKLVIWKPEFFQVEPVSIPTLKNYWFIFKSGILNCHTSLELKRLKLYPDPNFVVHTLSFFVLLFKKLKKNK